MPHSPKNLIFGIAGSVILESMIPDFTLAILTPTQADSVERRLSFDNTHAPLKHDGESVTVDSMRLTQAELTLIMEDAASSAPASIQTSASASLSGASGPPTDLQDAPTTGAALSVDSSLLAKKPLRILSLHGGGIRGIIELEMLKHFEKVSGKKIQDLFDVVAGTSIGGIIALGIAKGIPLETMSDILENRGKEIFSTFFLRSLFCGAKYSTDNLKKICTEHFGQDWLSDLKMPVIIPTYDFSREKPMIFNSVLAKSIPDMDVPVATLALATSAAPMYFKPRRMTSRSGIEYACLDGGIVANDPTLLAIAAVSAEARSTQELTVLTLGTGQTIGGVFEYSDLKRAGPLTLVTPIIDWTIRGPGGINEHVLNQMLNSSKEEQYFYLNPPINRENAKLDNVDLRNIHQLKYAAEQYISTHTFKIDRIVTRLMQPYKTAPATSAANLRIQIPANDSAASYQEPLEEKAA